jgi:hypothetical protein
VTQAALGLGRHPGQVHSSSVQFDEEQDVQPPEPDGIDGKEVAGNDPGLLA